MISKYDAYLVGHYGMQNSGDDALLLATLYGAQSVLGCKKMLVSSYNKTLPSGFSADIATLHEKPAFKGQNRMTHYIGAARSKRIIFGGGSVLNSAADINQKRHMMALAGKGKSMALGVGIAPFTYLNDELACRDFLNECGLVALRDQGSFDIAKDIAPRANLVKAFDLAPTLLSFGAKATQQPRSGVAINLCARPTSAPASVNAKAEAMRVVRICEFIEKLWYHTAQPVTLLSFNGHPVYGDHHIHNKIRARIGGRVPLKVVDYNPDPLEMLKILASFSAVVGMRLHCNIFSYMTNTPCMALNYHSKSVQWCHQVGIPADYQMDADNINPDGLLNKVLEITRSSKSSASLPVSDAIQTAFINWGQQYEQA